MNIPHLIDTHQHAFWHGHDDVGLVADLDANGIEKAWLLTWEETMNDIGGNYSSGIDPRYRIFGTPSTLLPLSTVYEVCRRYPQRFVAGYCPNPLDPEAVGKLAAAIDILGVRVCGEWKFNLHVDDPRCLELFHLAGKRGLPVVVHLDVPYLPPINGSYVGNRNWKGGTIHNLERALQACPETNFLGHAPGFWRELAAGADDYLEAFLKAPIQLGGRLPDLFERYPNLFGDLSAGSALRALKVDPAYTRNFLITFSDRLLFARDYHGSELLDFLKSLDLPEDAWQQIGRTNALRLVHE